MATDTADQMIAAALRGEHVAWPAPQATDFGAEFMQRCTFHGVCGLLHERQNAISDWPEQIKSAMRERALAQTMYELQHENLLKRVLTALAQRGVFPLIIKGTAFAYDVYPSPALRARGDTDLFIPEAERGLTDEVLTSLGFATAITASGDLVSYQATYSVTSASGHQNLDVHWKINNAQVLARLFSYGELRARAMALAGLAEHALSHGRVDGLLIACMHRAVHINVPYYVHGQQHLSADRYIWLCDIDLLARAFTEGEWEQLANDARAKELSGACLRGLKAAQDVLATPVPERILTTLASEPRRELASTYLFAKRPRQIWMDIGALQGSRQRLNYLSQVLLPSPHYMREKYAGARITWLPWLYARRAAGGVVKLTRRPRAKS